MRVISDWAMSRSRHTARTWAGHTAHTASAAGHAAPNSPLTRATTVEEYENYARQMYGAAADEFLALFPVTSDADVWAPSDFLAQCVTQAVEDDGGMLSALYAASEPKKRLALMERKYLVAAERRRSPSP